MALVPLVSEENIDATDRPLLEAGEKTFGTLLNTWLAIANCPGMFSTYLPFIRSVTGPGELDTRIKELTAVHVSLLNHCRYSVSHRCYSALNKGLSEADLERLATGDFASFTDRERLALRFTRALTLDLPETTREQSVTGVDAELLTEVRDAFNPRELVELVMSVGLWNALSRFHRVMDFDLDLGEPPAAVDAAVVGVSHSRDAKDLPAPEHGLLLTHFLTVSDVAVSRRFYADVFGGEVVMEENPAIVKVANSWIIMNPGGGPTPDKPDVTLQVPRSGDPVSGFLNVRVADMAAFHAHAVAKGANFLTEPIDRASELRCYLRDPDGHLIEVGQSTGLIQGIQADAASN